ncbi:MAG: 5'-nucleotidase C-terminal domain-containing protein [Chromatiaceae bacterium]|jgi:sulfur-oxidizing protein SoxB|nr:5'-nucleotidase C-terminal domain-containing protein [Chromatiaceae bacterium]
MSGPDRRSVLWTLVYTAFLLSAGIASAGGTGEVTLIHIGDLHGHLIPRAHQREEDPDRGHLVGGLAYMYTQIKEIRARRPDSLLINTGDTLQGGAEALFTRGQVMVDLLNDFGIDYFAAGNWDYLYGTERFRELFAGKTPLANWNLLAANLYYSTLYEFPSTLYPELAGQRVAPPYAVRDLGGVRVGVLGLTADRGPQAISPRVTDGFTMTPGEFELEQAIPLLREKEKVDVVVLISERGLASNLEMVETYPGVDVVLSSDMHEETWKALQAEGGTLLVAEGQDGTLVGELTLKVDEGKVVDHQWTMHRVGPDYQEPDPDVTARIEQARRTFVQGPDFRTHVNPISGAVLRAPIDTVIGFTEVPLHRSNFSDAKSMPAVIEGSSHDFLADAFRYACQSDLGMIRGFRYGTHVAPGPIRLEDIYHFIPIGPQIACGMVSGDQVRLMLERGADKVLNQYVGWWGGGWMTGFSGLTYDLDPGNEFGLRISNLKVAGRTIDLERYYRLAGYWYLDLPGKINRQPATEVRTLRDQDDGIVDATEVVAWYLQALPDHRVNPELNRVNVLGPLPAPIGPNREVQPLKGVPRPDY